MRARSTTSSRARRSRACSRARGRPRRGGRVAGPRGGVRRLRSRGRRGRGARRSARGARQDPRRQGPGGRRHRRRRHEGHHVARPTPGACARSSWRGRASRADGSAREPTPRHTRSPTHTTDSPYGCGGRSARRNARHNHIRGLSEQDGSQQCRFAYATKARRARVSSVPSRSTTDPTARTRRRCSTFSLSAASGRYLP